MTDIWPAGEGEMAARIRAHDWAATPLGPVGGWPSRLKVMVEFVLAVPAVSSLVCGPDRILIYNDAAARLYAGRHPAALGRPLPETFPEGWATVAPLYARVFAGETVQVVAQPLDTRGEGECPDMFDAILTPVRDDAGRVAFAHMIGVEIGTRARAEAALRESEERLAAIVAQAAVGLSRISPDERFLMVNDELCRILGWPKEDLLKASVMDVTLAEDVPMCLATVERVWTTGKPEAIDRRYLRRDGSLVYANSRLSRLDENGRPVAILAVTMDLTERLRTEAALRESEERLAAIVAQASVGLSKIAIDGRFLMVNDELCRILGRSREELLRSGVPGVTHAADLPASVAAVQRVWATGRPESVNKRYLRPDGTLIHTNSRLSRLDESGEPGAILAVTIDLTERVHAEAALRESEERLAAIVAQASVGLSKIAIDGRFLMVNDELCRMAGRSREELLRTNVADLTFVEDKDACADMVRRVWATGRSEAADRRYVYRDGSLIYANSRLSRLDVNGEASAILSVTVDLTDRVQAEAALRASGERLRRTLEIDTVGVAFWDLGRGAVIAANEAWCRMTGYEHEAAAGLTWRQLTPPEFHCCSERMMQELRATGRATPHERQYVRKDGSRWWGLFAARRLDGQEMVEFVLDVSERRQAEQARADSEARLRSLLEGIPQLVWRAVNGDRWTWSSPQWCACTGQTEAESLGQGWLEAVHPDDREAARQAWASADLGAPLAMEGRLYSQAEGRYRWFQTRATPVRDAEGRIVEWLGTSTDIDDQVRAREVLARSHEELEARVAERTSELRQALDSLHAEVLDRQRAEERLRQSEKLKAIGQLTGGIAHDFNNMLQAIITSLGLIRYRLRQGRPGEIAEYVDMADGAAERAALLTNRLLAFGRQQTLSPEPVSLDRIARQMEEIVRRSVGPGVRVELRLAGGAWRVMCDPNQLESALLNLCINARDAMPGSGWLTISTADVALSESDAAAIGDAAAGRYVAIAVSDTGTGMPPEVAARAFEPFFTTKPLGAGTGLGLSQIHGFVHQSGGLVQLETVPGKGTTVRLCLPVHDADPDPERGAAPAASPGRTVLLVEDEQDVRRLTAQILRDLGCLVLEAEDGAAALRLVRTGARIDLLITDYGLPGNLNGRQVVEAARERHSGLPAILITGYAGGEPMPGLEILRKPFAPPVLIDLVRARLDAIGSDAG